MFVGKGQNSGGPFELKKKKKEWAAEIYTQRRGPVTFQIFNQFWRLTLWLLIPEISTPELRILFFSILNPYPILPSSLILFFYFLLFGIFADNFSCILYSIWYYLQYHLPTHDSVIPLSKLNVICSWGLILDGLLGNNYWFDGCIFSLCLNECLIINKHWINCPSVWTRTSSHMK